MPWKPSTDWKWLLFSDTNLAGSLLLKPATSVGFLRAFTSSSWSRGHESMCGSSSLSEAEPTSGSSNFTSLLLSSHAVKPNETTPTRNAITNCLNFFIVSLMFFYYYYRNFILLKPLYALISLSMPKVTQRKSFYLYTPSIRRGTSCSIRSGRTHTSSDGLCATSLSARRCRSLLPRL